MNEQDKQRGLDLLARVKEHEQLLDAIFASDASTRIKKARVRLTRKDILALNKEIEAFEKQAGIDEAAV